MVKVSSGVIGNIVSQYNQKALAILQDEGLKFLNFFKCPGSILSSSWRKYHKLDKICLRKLRAVLVKTKPWWKSTKLYACRSFYTLVRDSIIRKIQAFDAQFLQIIFVISERTESFMWTYCRMEVLNAWSSHDNLDGSDTKPGWKQTDHFARSYMENWNTVHMQSVVRRSGRIISCCPTRAVRRPTHPASHTCNQSINQLHTLLTNQHNLVSHPAPWPEICLKSADKRKKPKTH